MKREYTAEPTAALFHADESFVRGIMGPIGSGKSVACVQEVIHRAAQQKPNERGERKTRWAVIRNTYPELTSTTIKTWADWLPSPVCHIVYSSSPITGKLRAPLSDGTRIDCEVLFIALDLPKDVKKLLSLELTGAWINEARELDKSIIDTVTSRVGRYPAKMDGGPSWSGVIMDTNPPDETHWWYKLAEEDQPEGWRFFRQPGALIEREGKYVENTAAENVEHQPLGIQYWLRQVPGKSKEWIKVYILGDYGTVLDGKAVYADAWSDTLHVADVAYIERHEIFVAWDWGLTPAAVFMQISPRGRVQVLDEVIGDNIGARQFAEGFVIPLLKGKYKTSSVTHIGDPAGKQRGQADERSVFEELLRLGIRVTPAPSNIPLRRWEAVRYYLGQLKEGKPVFALSPACKTLRKGFNGGYRFRRMQISGDERYSETAEKNMYSHCHDALGYGCEYLRDTTGRLSVKAPETPPPSAAGWT